MAKLSLRRKRPVQNGVNAIFSGKVQHLPEYDNLIQKSTSMRPKRDGGHMPFSRVLSAILLMGIGLTMITGSFFVDLRSRQFSGSAGQGPKPPVRVAPRVAPGFLALTNIPEMIVQSGRSYSGLAATAARDFLVVQIAYSEGGLGNLPNLSNVSDNMSTVYARLGSASPGVGSNFWEQVWIGRASSSTSTNVTVTPDWTSCTEPCVTSIIVSMTVARYRDVGGLGASTVIAPHDSANSQVAKVAVSQPESVLVELLSHGAYNTCESDAATPGSGQTLRSCFTGSTERTEFFDHNVSEVESYNESYAWSQLEVQRGIYLELEGSAS